jgi:hypothetical protein
MAKKTKATETVQQTEASERVPVTPDAEISPERVKKIRHFTNYAKKPYISKPGTFKPEVFEETVKKATEEEIIEIFRWVFTEKPGDIEAARARLITLIKDGN